MRAGRKFRSGLKSGPGAGDACDRKFGSERDAARTPSASQALRAQEHGRPELPAAADLLQPYPGGRAERRAHETPGRWDLMPAAPIENMAAELLANHNLLAALAGPTIALTVDVEGAARPVRMTGEDLTRVLVNLVKNAAEAMPGGGRIQIELGEMPASAGAMEALALTIEDSGPGIPGRGQGGDLHFRLYHARERHRTERKLAGDSSRAGAVDYPFDRGSRGRANHGRAKAPRAERGSRSSCRCGEQVDRSRD